MIILDTNVVSELMSRNQRRKWLTGCADGTVVNCG